MLWFIIAIFAYFVLAVVALIDEIFLTERLIKPKVYAFYVGLLGGLALLLIPFGCQVPDLNLLFLAILSGGLWIFALLALYEGLRRYEISRVVPAVGGILPIFTLGFSYLFAWQKGEPFSGFNYIKIISFVLMVLGSILITWERGKNITRQSLGLALLTALLFALSFSTSKLVFLEQPFISGFIWLRLGGLFTALSFIFFKEIREELFEKIKIKKKKALFENPKLAVVFLLNQTMGAGAGILQSLAIYLAPIMYLAFINAMEGIRYVFILIFTIILSYKMPKILSEKITKPIVIRKTFAILLIVAGLIILTIN
jgi:hypothetical protein